MISKEALAEAWKLAGEFKFGLYKHYKGGTYSAIMMVTHHETRAPMVVYVSHNYGSTNVRPLLGWKDDQDCWISCVTVQGNLGYKTVDRFTYIGPLPSDTKVVDR